MILLIIIKETHSVNANLIIKNVKSIIIRKKMEIICRGYPKHAFRVPSVMFQLSDSAVGTITAVQSVPEPGVPAGDSPMFFPQGYSGPFLLQE